MKLMADIAGEKVDVELTHDGDSVRANIDGRKYELRVTEPEPGVLLIKKGAEIHQAFLSQRPDNAYAVRLGNAEIDITLTDPKRLRGSAGTAEHADGQAEIKTAMPGKVVRILVNKGDTVAKGDGVIVVEAMKMQNEMKAPKDGAISQIKVAEGDTVTAGDVLVVIE